MLPFFESYRALKQVHFQEDHTGHRFSVFKVLTCKFFRIRKNKLCLYTKGYKTEWYQLESEVRGRQNNPGKKSYTVLTDSVIWSFNPTNGLLHRLEKATNLL